MMHGHKSLKLINSVLNEEEFRQGWKESYYFTVQSQFSKSWPFEFPFCPSWCTVVKVVSMLGREFRWNAHFCVHARLSGITVFHFCCFLCAFLRFQFVL